MSQMKRRGRTGKKKGSSNFYFPPNPSNNSDKVSPRARATLQILTRVMLLLPCSSPVVTATTSANAPNAHGALKANIVGQWIVQKTSRCQDH